MNGKQLRNSILQWAISGRLVPQDPTDEPAIELLKRINPKATPITEEVPFSIPDNWCWCMVGDIGNIITGSTPSKSIKDYYNGDIPFFKPTDLEQGINVCESGDHISELGYKQSRQLPPNSILVTCIGATIGKTGLTAVAGTCNQQINAIVPNNVVLPLYVYFACVSDCMQTKIKTNASATTLPILNKGNFARLPFPLPPLAEQERIVGKVEELLPLVERYDKAQTELDRLNASLKGKLRASVLQEAISGRLVPQDPNDEPAIALLRRINPKAVPLNPDDAPFTIPDSWCWCKVGDIVQINPKNDCPDEAMAAFIPMEKVGATYGSQYTYDKVKWGSIKKGYTHFANGDVAFAKITPCFQNRKSAVFNDLPNGIGAGTTELKVLRPYGETLNRWYLLYFLKSSYFIAEAKFKGTANQQRVVKGYLENKMFPLPPLAEQERIVGKVEELFAVLDALQ